MGADRRGRGRDLVRGERVQFGFGRGAQLDAAARGAGDQLVVEGEGDDGFEDGAVDLPDRVGRQALGAQGVDPVLDVGAGDRGDGGAGEGR